MHCLHISNESSHNRWGVHSVVIVHLRITSQLLSHSQDATKRKFCSFTNFSLYFVNENDEKEILSFIELLALDMMSGESAVTSSDNRIWRNAIEIFIAFLNRKFLYDETKTIKPKNVFRFHALFELNASRR